MAENRIELLKEISTKLDAVLALMRIAFRENIEAAKERAFARSDIKKSIYEMCDGRNTVSDMAKQLDKEPAYIRVYLATLQEEGLVVRKNDTYEAVV